MSNTNKVGLFAWFLVLVGLIVKLPFNKVSDFIYFLILFIGGTIMFFWEDE